MRRRQRGFIILIVTIGLAALGLVAGITSVVINNANNQRTAQILMDPDTTASQLQSLTDQDLQNLRNELPNNAQLLTGFTSLGTTTLPGGQTSAEVAGSTLVQLANDNVRPAVVDYMSDPASSWNLNGGQQRPSEGTTPTGGVVPSAADMGTTGGNSFTATITIGGGSVPFSVVTTWAGWGTYSTGSTHLTNLPSVAAWDTAGTFGATSSIVSIETNPMNLLGTGNYGFDSPSVFLSAYAELTYSSPQFKHYDGTEVVFECQSGGSLNLTHYGPNIGDQFSGTYSCSLLGQQKTSSTTQTTLSGTISGSFDATLSSAHP